MKALQQPPKEFTPERIHEALRIINQSSWLTPGILGGVLLISLVYMVFGKIPVSGEGNALVLTRGTVIPFQATASGQIAQWHVKVGDTVEAGQLLAVLEQPETQKQLEQSRQKLDDVADRNEVVASLESTYTNLALKALEQRDTMLTKRIEVLEEEIEENKLLVERNLEQNLRVLKQRKTDLESTVALEVQRSREFSDKLAKVIALEKQKLRSRDQLLVARQAASQAEIQVANARLALLRHNLNEVKASENYLDSQNQIATREEQLMDLRLEHAELRNQRTSLEKQATESDLNRSMEVSDLQRKIGESQKSLTESRELISEYDGKLLELTVAKGERVTKGLRLGTVDTRSESAEVEAVAYFEVKDGKRLTPGMTLRLTPATVQRERFGSLLAVVTEVADLPISVDGAAAVVGNAAVAQSLTQDGHVIQVFAKLVKDDSTASGYQWDTSHGPEHQVSSGTLADAFVNIEERPPLTFIIPILRSWKGFDFGFF